MNVRYFLKSSQVRTDVEQVSQVGEVDQENDDEEYLHHTNAEKVILVGLALLLAHPFLSIKLCPRWRALVEEKEGHFCAADGANEMTFRQRCCCEQQ